MMRIPIRQLLFFLCLVALNYGTVQAGIKRVPVGEAEVIQPSQAKYRKAKVLTAAPAKDKQAPIVRKAKVKTRAIEPKVVEPEVATATAETADQADIVAGERELPTNPELRRALEKAGVEILESSPADSTATAETLEAAGVYRVADAAPEKPVVEKKKTRKKKKKKRRPER